MKNAFVIHHCDNVATLLEQCDAQEPIKLIGDSSADTLTAIAAIRPEHKVALSAICKDTPIIKYGMPIGYAVTNIKAGEWVHLHNSGSYYDERSNTLDGDSGAPTDTQYV